MDTNYTNIKDTLRSKRDEIKLIGFSVSSAIASLVYSEYLRNFRRTSKQDKILIPSVRLVSELLSPDKWFYDTLASSAVDLIVNNELMREFLDIPEFILFGEDNIDVLKIIFELYILPEISRSIPDMIIQKFGLSSGKNETFQESNDLTLFNGNQPTGKQFEFITDQAVIQMLLLTPSVSKTTVPEQSNINISLANDNHSVLTVGNRSAISAVHFNKQVLDNDDVRNLLSFVTNTTFSYITNGDTYNVTSSAFNQVISSTIKRINN